MCEIFHTQCWQMSCGRIFPATGRYEMCTFRRISTLVNRVASRSLNTPTEPMPKTPAIKWTGDATTVGRSLSCLLGNDARLQMKCGVEAEVNTAAMTAEATAVTDAPAVATTITTTAVHATAITNDITVAGGVAAAVAVAVAIGILVAAARAPIRHHRIAAGRTRARVRAREIVAAQTREIVAAQTRAVVAALARAVAAATDH